MSAIATTGRLLEELVARCRVETLDNGLTVCALENPQAPLVATALWYRAGTRHEPPGAEGVAHFLEHMMFKGSPAFGPGEVDRLTQALGGSNNAFTGHDASCFYFTFARDCWLRALDIEADRMASLTFEPAEIDRERSVVLEEISMYEDDPWDALELAVHAEVYGGHPYGRPLLGTRESLRRMGIDELASFHRDHYRPDRAVLVVAGDLSDGVLGEVAERFADLPAGGTPSLARPDAPADWGTIPCRQLGPRRVERRRGSRSRLLVALPAPAGDREDFAALWLAVSILAAGRASRLQRELVDEGRLCASVSVEVTEMVGPGLTVVTAEPLAEVSEARVEAVLRRELERLPDDGQPSELERARRLLLADWVFAIERIHQQALLMGGALARFRLASPVEFVRRIENATLAEVKAADEKYLALRHPAVIGWSLPE